jgi:hypothetical protein
MRAVSGLALLLLLPGLAAAQAEPPDSASLQVGSFAADGRVAVAPGTTALSAAWTLAFSDAVAESAAFAAGNATLHWELACYGDLPGMYSVLFTEREGQLPEVPARHVDLHLVQATTAVPLEPGKAEYQGNASLTVQAGPDVLGVVDDFCVLGARLSAGAGQLTAWGWTSGSLAAAYVHRLDASLPRASASAGPQKQIPYEVEFANHGNARTRVTFEMADRPGGTWNAILPEELVLPPGGQGSAFFTVATPFYDGYVSAQGDYVVRALPAAADDRSLTADPIEFRLHADVHGWYVPGPSPLLAVAALGLVAVLRRR